MELLFILVPIFAFVLVRQSMETRAKERAERMRLLEQALANPAVDRQTLAMLTQQLTGARAPGQRGRGMAFLLAIGWLTLFTGLGLLAIGMLRHSSDASSAGMITGLVGFGLVTYPFALRELDSRRQAG